MNSSFFYNTFYVKNRFKTNFDLECLCNNFHRTSQFMSYFLIFLQKKYSQTFYVYILQKKFAFMKYRYLYLTISSGENLMHYGDIIKIIILIFVPFSILRNLSKKLVHEKIDLPDKCIQFRKD